MRWALLILVVSILAGCGAGSGGTGVASVQPGQVILALSTEGGTPATVLYAVEFTLRLPPGVSVGADPASGEVAANLLQPDDGAAVSGARYLPGGPGSPGSVRINIADPVGFTVGPLAKLTCTTTGAALGGADFSLENFAAKDANGIVIDGITPSLTVRSP